MKLIRIFIAILSTLVTSAVLTLGVLSPAAAGVLVLTGKLVRKH